MSQAARESLEIKTRKKIPPLTELKICAMKYIAQFQMVTCETRQGKRARARNDV